MDCEKFDQHVIDELYDELDELTHAALKRHVEGCARCAGVLAGLRATREVGVLPMVEPPDDLEARILDAVAVAQQRAPWHKKVLRGLAWAGSHAMRPQLAMAALFFLVIGSSLLLLGARPGTRGPVSVTERGSPAPEMAEADQRGASSRAAAAPPVAMASVTAETATPGGLGAPALDDGAGTRTAAPRAFAEPPADRRERGPGGSADDARAALAEARSVRDSAGCAAAVPKLDAVAVSFAGTQSAADAWWDEASCYKQMGDPQRARQLYTALRATGYRERAEQELTATDNNLNNNPQSQVAARAASPPPPPAVAVAPTPAATAAPAEADRSAGAAGSKAKAKPAAGATNPHAPAAPKRAFDSNSAFAP